MVLGSIHSLARSAVLRSNESTRRSHARVPPGRPGPICARARASKPQNARAAPSSYHSHLRVRPCELRCFCCSGDEGGGEGGGGEGGGGEGGGDEVGEGGGVGGGGEGGDGEGSGGNSLSLTASMLPSPRAQCSHGPSRSTRRKG